ncbi:hypothetical protein M2161_007570 [Streptomyces sp. SAI-133]|uniref:hypothetical protein n=1 Tax=unclassified Streptomyces TaxID=2593676 RepID=UPI002473C47E|nr:hypothetical protein [Streptomyces sp. SAI-133]MDH6588464.1 hypothetical protein [Streptomyces sp. SAI-133]
MSHNVGTVRVTGRDARRHAHAPGTPPHGKTAHGTAAHDKAAHGKAPHGTAAHGKAAHAPNRTPARTTRTEARPAGPPPGERGAR